MVDGDVTEKIKMRFLWRSCYGSRNCESNLYRTSRRADVKKNAVLHDYINKKNTASVEMTLFFSNNFKENNPIMLFMIY